VFDGGASTPISEIIFGQWVALMAARARGLNPDDPRFLSKVTLTL
jgi:glucosamine--fructose-6-phosphate aminotransferase (isomerizing)